jgi:RNA polymerase sigma factor (sigma-70 family)
MTNDLDLLGQFNRDHSQDAFAALVNRHVNLVYSAALRQVRSPQLAEEVAQSVFTDLARNAGKLKPDTILTAWLYQVTRRTAVDVVRKESRRQLREQIASEMNAMNATVNDWTHIEPLLDDAMAVLDDTDRAAVLLRYFENKSLREVGQTLGTSDDAAQKRVSRAVERLREFFTKRNVTIGTSGLAVLISANAVQAAPTGLSAAILTAAIETTKTIGMNMIHKLLITGMTAAAVGTGIYAFHLQSQIRSLQQQQTLLGQQIGQLSHERDEATNQLAVWQQENGQLRANETELLKLRAEVSQLRRQQNVSPVAAQSETNNLPHVEKTSIHVGTKFILFPTKDLQALGVEWTSGPQDSRVGLLTEQQFKVINEALQGASDVNFIGAPVVITSSGNKAQISVSKPVPAGGTNVNVGISLGVMPYFLTNSSTFDLNLAAELKQLVGDSSQPGVQTTQITNQVSLLPGQTVVLEKEIPSGGWLPDSTNIPAGPRSFLVFVTPAIVDSRDYERNGQRIAGMWVSPTNMDSRGFPKSQ